MTHNGNDVVAPTAQAATPAVTFPFLFKLFFLLPPLSLLYRVIVGVVFVGVIVVIIIFKSLHLAKICTLTIAF